jgi:hypothetical protein
MVDHARKAVRKSEHSQHYLTEGKPLVLVKNRTYRRVLRDRRKPSFGFFPKAQGACFIRFFLATKVNKGKQIMQDKASEMNR